MTRNDKNKLFDYIFYVVYAALFLLFATLIFAFESHAVYDFVCDNYILCLLAAALPVLAVILYVMEIIGRELRNPLQTSEANVKDAFTETDYRCLYCGSPKLLKANVPVKYRRNNHITVEEYILRLCRRSDETYYVKGSHKSDYYRCPKCRVLILQQELNRETAQLKIRTASQSGSGHEKREDKDLINALNLMKHNQCDLALDILFNDGYPFEYGPVFAVCRNICQVIPLFSHNSLEERYKLLDIAAGNLQLLHSIQDKRILRQSLFYINNALLILADEPINSQTDYSQIKSKRKRSEFDLIHLDTDYTNRKRTVLLSGFAGFLESQADNNAANALEYRKMAVELYHKCLNNAQENHGHCLVGADREILLLDPAEYRRITAKIKRLNAAICREEPGFAAKEPSKAPWRPSPWLILTFIGTVSIAFAYAAVNDEELLTRAYVQYPLIFTAGTICLYLLYQKNKL